MEHNTTKPEDYKRLAQEAGIIALGIYDKAERETVIRLIRSYERLARARINLRGDRIS